MLAGRRRAVRTAPASATLRHAWASLPATMHPPPGAGLAASGNPPVRASSRQGVVRSPLRLTSPRCLSGTWRGRGARGAGSISRCGECSGGVWRRRGRCTVCTVCTGCSVGRARLPPQQPRETRVTAGSAKRSRYPQAPSRRLPHRPEQGAPYPRYPLANPRRARLTAASLHA